MLTILSTLTKTVKSRIRNPQTWGGGGGGEMRGGGGGGGGGGAGATGVGTPAGLLTGRRLALLKLVPLSDSARTALHYRRRGKLR